MHIDIQSHNTIKISHTRSANPEELALHPKRTEVLEVIELVFSANQPMKIVDMYQLTNSGGK